MWLALSSENTLSDGEFPAIARLVDEEGGEQNRSVGELQLFAGQSITLGPLVNNQDDLPRMSILMMNLQKLLYLLCGWEMTMKVGLYSQIPTGLLSRRVEIE